ncbi:hypothetical protein BSKO_00008 [Bryopsis sp. KO-2023]|nr:hypothetical protein BSKO_00008 [Bryopsis sp. KO-2023]
MERVSVACGGNQTELEVVRNADPLWTQDSAYEREGDDSSQRPASTVTERDTRARKLFAQDSARSREDGGKAVLCHPEIEVHAEFGSPVEASPKEPHVYAGRVVALFATLASLFTSLVRWASQLGNLASEASLAPIAFKRGAVGVNEADLVCVCQVLSRAKGTRLKKPSRHQQISGTHQAAISPLHPRFLHRADGFLTKAMQIMGEDGVGQFLTECGSAVEKHQAQGDRKGKSPAATTAELDEMLAACPELRTEFRKLVLNASKRTHEGNILRESCLDGNNWNNAFDSPIGVEYIERIEQIGEEMARLGLRITSFGDSVAWLASKCRPRHFPIFTYLYGGLSLIIFSFMAGAYPTYEYVDGLNNNDGDRLSEEKARASPEDILGWISLSQRQSFPFEYLLAWGGRYGPSILSGDWWRWFTSPFVHQNFQHVMSNALLLASLCGYIEYIYGTWRTVLVFFVTSLAGNFMSASFEDPCVLVVGASGAVFGFMGFFIADSVKNFESITRPMLRLTIVIGFALFFLFTVFGSQKESYVSHYSHVGGLLCGLMASFLIIPNLKQQNRQVAQAVARRLDVECSQIGTPKANKSRNQLKLDIWEESIWSKFSFHPLAIAGLLVVATMFCALPIYLYTNRLPETSCSEAHVVMDSASLPMHW